MCSSISRRNIGSIDCTDTLRSIVRGVTTWRRLKARSCIVNPAARSAAVGDGLDAPERRIVIERGSSIWREVLREHLAEPADREQHVVEIVRDPAGEAPDRLQFLRLEELRLGRLAGRDVDDRREDLHALVGDDR